MDNASAAMSEPRICPFLRAAHDGRLADPLGWPDPANACIALGDVAPQSLRQQEYACLASAHVNCPRFVRGVHRMIEAAPAPVDAGLRLTPAILGALLVLAASFALSVGFVVANGGMDLPVPSSASPEAVIASGAPGPSGSSAPVVTEPPAASAAPTVAPTPEASVESATATPSSTATPDYDADAGRDAARELRSVRPAGAVRGRAGLLDLHDPRGRQPDQHRPLLRRAIRRRRRAQSLDRDHAPRGRPGTAAAATDPVGRIPGRDPGRVLQAPYPRLAARGAPVRNRP